MTYNTTTTTNLTSKYIQEITSTFQIFDEKKTGYISPNAFKLLLRSLGIRISRTTVYSHILEEKKIRKGDSDTDVDLEMCLSIVERYYPKLDSDLIRESKLNFRLFARTKGYITLEDLQRVVQEVQQGLQEMDAANYDTNNIQDELNFNIEKMKDMMEEFDTNCDGVISYDEFVKIMNYNPPNR